MYLKQIMVLYILLYKLMVNLVIMLHYDLIL